MPDHPGTGNQKSEELSAMLQYPDRRPFLYANTWMRDSVHQFLRPRRSNILTTEAYQAIKRQRIRAARVEPSRIAGRRPPSSARRRCLNRERYRKENVREAEGGGADGA